jgi:hypothetical protein
LVAGYKFEVRIVVAAIFVHHRMTHQWGIWSWQSRQADILFTNFERIIATLVDYI